MTGVQTCALPIYGEANDDTLNGGRGNDTYRWNLGDGNDMIQDDTSSENQTALNHLVFGVNILPSDVTMEALPNSSSNLKFVIKQNGVVNGSVTINYWNYVSNGPHSKTWRIEFANGVVWNGAILATPLADIFDGTAGADTLNGGAGNDTLNGLDGNDALNGEANDDTLNGGRGNDTYRWNLGDGNDMIQDDTSSENQTAINHLDFGVNIIPSDVTMEVIQNSTSSLKFIIKQSGVVNGSVTINYWNYVSDGPHSKTWRIEFANGVVWNGAILATPFADILDGTAGADTLNGGVGNDTLSGLDGNDTINGEADDDSLSGGNGDDSLAGGLGNDLLQGGYGNDLLNGGPGNDTLDGGVGNDVYTWNLGDGDDVITDDIYSGGSGEVNRLVFGPGITPSDVTSEAVLTSSYHLKFVIRQNGVVSGSVIVNYWTNNYLGPQHKDRWRIDFSNGVTWDGTTLTTPLADTLSGTALADSLNGGAGNDTLNGLDGNDTLNGDADNDTLNGGEGNDLLSGGAGVDSLNGGNGRDLLNGGAGNDSLNGGVGNDVYTWNLGDGDDVITDDIYSDGPGEVNRLVFGPGIMPSDVTSEAVSTSSYHLKFVIRQNGVVSGSVMVSNYWTHSYLGPQHKDSWRIDFSNGVTWDGTTLTTPLADTLSGTALADTLNGGAGNDTINGLDGNDTLNGDADNDTLNGGNGSDLLNGGAGNDSLNGGAGNDVYTWNLGDGDDVITDDIYSGSPGEVNRLVFGPGIMPSDVTSEAVSTSSYQLKFVIRQNGVVSGSVIVNYWTYSYSGPQHKDSWRIDFNNGVTWDGTTLTTPLADTLSGTALADTLNGGPGNDTLNGLDGNDTLNGDADDDSLSGGNGDDSLAGGLGNDILQGGNGSDSLAGSLGNDVLQGGNGSDLLNGGPGNDTLDGGVGNDVYTWNLGDGDDVITDDIYSGTPGEVNRLVFGPGIMPSDVTSEAVSTSSYQLKFVIRQNGVVSGSVIVNYWTYSYSGPQLKDTWRIEFADGGRYYQNLLPTLWSDVVDGTDEDDTFFGYAGDDVLSGKSGIDVLVGGVGNDRLIGGSGSDEYRFNRGDGRDVVTETPEASSENIIILGNGIAPADYRVIKVNDSLVLFDRLSESTIEIKNWWPLGLAPIQKVRFANGLEWTSAQLSTMAVTTGDTNRDGISDVNAYAYGISIINADMDSDGIENSIEINLGLNPSSADSDNDGILDSLDSEFSSGAPTTGALVISILSPSSAILND